MRHLILLTFLILAIAFLLLSGCTSASINLRECKKVCGFIPVNRVHTEITGDQSRIDCVCMPVEQTKEPNVKP